MYFIINIINSFKEIVQISYAKQKAKKRETIKTLSTSFARKLKKELVKFTKKK